VLLITSKQGFKVLLPGDIEEVQEKYILNHPMLLEKLKNIDVLVAAHHGSKTSSSKKFIEHLKADLVIYTNAYKHFYHFPHPSVVNRFSQTDAIQETTSNGQIAFMSPDKLNDKINLNIYRRDKAKVWNRPYQSVDDLQKE